MTEAIASKKSLETLVSAYIEGPARQTCSKLASANKKGTLCENFGEIKVIYYARNLDDSIGAAKKMPEGTTASPEEVPEAATLSTQAHDPVPGSADPKIKVAKDNFIHVDRHG
ncbi:hypothetical protein E4U60_001182 [Claviceps pazoutovae]|uniref:Uncharacterized protein n=1 Tax=Claviceps pazoutovae TaxID=1649127 RepID=A0A9P7MDB0_9HYPO|nr:hypothetical protein E4U60_001182 [Claviceps pazoutovae]